MLEIARVRLKRKKYKAKPSAFYINEKPVREAKIDRYLKRNNISDNALLSIASPENGM
jgi:chromosome segregation ATPase